MASDIRTILTRLLKELDSEEEKELLESLKGKKLTHEELLEAIRSMPPEHRKEVREALAEVKEEIEEEEETKPKPKPTAEEEEEEEEETKPKNRTRPGRKSGKAYGWWVGEDGEIVKLDIARIYTGEDEPDEVEMLPKDEEEEEEENEEEAS